MRVCCAGEVMVELAAVSDAGMYRQGLAGDSYNTAIYLAREGVTVEYLTRLGDDYFSDAVIDQLQQEGIDTKNIARIPGRQPGLYLISNDLCGERRFHYWREQSPARELFEDSLEPEDWAMFYFTGITLAVMRSGIANMERLLARLQQRNTRIVFDPNYRPGLWRDESEAREYYRLVLPYCDTVLPTLDDETALWGITKVADCVQWYRDFGAGEIVVKDPDLVAHAFSAGQEVRLPAQPVTAADTTGAGDSFNAAYLASRMRGEPLEAALAAGQRLASAVVQHRGALLPRTETR